MRLRLGVYQRYHLTKLALLLGSGLEELLILMFTLHFLGSWPVITKYEADFSSLSSLSIDSQRLGKVFA